MKKIIALVSLIILVGMARPVLAGCPRDIFGVYKISELRCLKNCDNIAIVRDNGTLEYAYFTGKKCTGTTCEKIYLNHFPACGYGYSIDLSKRGAPEEKDSYTDIYLTKEEFDSTLGQPIPFSVARTEGEITLAYDVTSTRLQTQLNLALFNAETANAVSQYTLIADVSVAVLIFVIFFIWRWHKKK